MRFLAAVALAAVLGTAAAQTKEKSKKTQCEGYQRQLDSNAARARKGGDSKTMERLSEERRKISDAQRKAGC